MTARVAVLAAGLAAAAGSLPEVLLVATRRPIEELRNARISTSCLRKDGCRDHIVRQITGVLGAGLNLTVAVGAHAERAAVVAFARPFAAVAPGRLSVVVEPPGPLNSTRALRRFKVAAIARFAATAGAFVYLDNDAILQPRPAREGLAEEFAAMVQHGKSLGLVAAPNCVPHTHGIKGIPRSFCERNSGAIFARPPRAAEVLAAWLREFEAFRAADGHDQQSLRKVLWENKETLYDLPPRCNCRACNYKNDPRPCLVHHGTYRKRCHHALLDRECRRNLRRKSHLCKEARSRAGMR